MNDTLDYYKQTIVCPLNCGWMKGPWEIFRYPSEIPDNLDGDLISASYMRPEKCPKCGSDFAGKMSDMFYGNENPYVLYVWDEIEL